MSPWGRGLALAPRIATRWRLSWSTAWAAGFPLNGEFTATVGPFDGPRGSNLTEELLGLLSGLGVFPPFAPASLLGICPLEGLSTFRGLTSTRDGFAFLGFPYGWAVLWRSCGFWAPEFVVVLGGAVLRGFMRFVSVPGCLGVAVDVGAGLLVLLFRAFEEGRAAGVPAVREGLAVGLDAAGRLVLVRADEERDLAELDPADWLDDAGFAAVLFD